MHYIIITSRHNILIFTSSARDGVFCLELPTLRSFIFPCTESAISLLLFEPTVMNREKFVRILDNVRGCLAGLNAPVAEMTRGTAPNKTHLNNIQIYQPVQSICVPEMPAKYYTAHKASDRVISLYDL